MVEGGNGKVAVRVEQGQAFAGSKVLVDEIEQQRALAGAGLADDVEMPAAFLRSKQHIAALGGMGAESQRLLALYGHSRNGAGVPCAPQLGRWCGLPSVSLGSRGRRSDMASEVVVRRLTLTAALPAHCRLVSGHDLWSEMVAALDCTVACETGGLKELHQARKPGAHRSFALALALPTACDVFLFN